MTELDIELGPLAVELIGEFGKLITIETVGPGVYDPTTGVNTPGSNVVAVKAIVEDYSLVGSGQGYATGLIENGDKKVTIAAQSLATKPTTSDLLKIDGLTYVVTNVKAVYTGELVALYEIQARLV